MELICKWFQNNLDIVFFVYGFAFVTMGIIIWAQQKKESSFRIANILWLLAGFGAIHGVNEWLDMWSIIRGGNQILDLIRWFCLFVSYLFLFEFGRRLFRITEDACPAWRKKIAEALAWWLSPLIAICILILGFASSDFWKIGSNWTRYLLGFPGGVLSGLGFLSYYRCSRRQLEQLKLKKYFLLAGLSFLIYGFLGGLVVSKADFFPFNWLNSDSFFLAVKIPVQVFRAICAVCILWGVSGMLEIFRDENLRNIRNALAEREKITEGIDEGLLLLDRNFKIIWANKKERDSYGEIAGDYCYHATHNRNDICSPPHDICPVTEVMRTGKPVTVLHTHFDNKGNAAWIEVSAYPIRNKAGEIVEFVHVSRDVTEKVKLEETIKSIGDPLIIINPKGSIIVANPPILRLTGYREEELIGKPADILFTDDTRMESVIKRLKGNDVVQNIEIEILGQGGDKIIVSLSASLVKHKGELLDIVCILRDIREINQLQAELIQAAKLSSIGRLAAGVAHELNNPLTTIIARVDLLAYISAKTLSDEDKKTLIVKSEALRMKDIIGGIQTFSKKSGGVTKDKIDLNSIIRKVESFMNSDITSSKIKIVNELSDIPEITANADTIMRIFINLFSNSIDALNGQARINKEWKMINASTEYCGEKDIVKIKIKDNGPGMNEKTRKSIFEPFFTTKDKGTGLGLSIVYGIVKDHGGDIYVDSKEGEYTEFVVALPVAGAGRKPMAANDYII